MKILIRSGHSYPAIDRGNGCGKKAREFPSGAGPSIHDLLVKGLAELGHEVFYMLKHAKAPLPEGVHHVSEPLSGMDIYHNQASKNTPWVSTQHFLGDKSLFNPNTICVSKALAKHYNSERVVYNGLDPKDYIFCSQKEDYFLYLSSMGRHRPAYELKGLPIALQLAKEKGLKLIVAGSSTLPSVVEEVDQLCKKNGAIYIGDVRGQKKAQLFARAKAFIFPTQLEEAFGLVMLEALFSGTPVICSNNGACQEIISSDVGFVCNDFSDYKDAVDQIDNIEAKKCRERAMEKFHYLEMARNYVEEYKKEMEAFYSKMEEPTPY